MEKRDLNEAIAATLDHRLSEVIRLPDNAALVEAARTSYRAGWDEAADVSGNNLETHPADRRLRISDKRLEAGLARLPRSRVPAPGKTAAFHQQPGLPLPDQELPQTVPTTKPGDHRTSLSRI